MASPSVIRIKGNTVPSFIYGTAWKEADTYRCVLEALKAGFRGIDTANQRRHYREDEAGRAIEEACKTGLVDRGELFLQSKFTHKSAQDDVLPYDRDADIRTQVNQSVESSLRNLRTSHLDSYLLHGPSGGTGLTAEDLEAWSAIEDLHKNGKLRMIGISNVSLAQLTLLCGKATVPPVFVQNRCYAARGWDRDIRHFCQKNEICYQGFSLLTANSGIFNNARFKDVADRHGCSGAQLVFCFAMQLGMIPLTGTSSALHMQEDLKARQFTLSSHDMKILEYI